MKPSTTLAPEPPPARPQLVSRLVELTAREREVLALMAQGLTDRGIAERLVVCRKTVETHVRHIFFKLRVPAGPHDNRRVHAVLAYLHSGAAATDASGIAAIFADLREITDDPRASRPYVRADPPGRHDADHRRDGLQCRVSRGSS